MKIVITGGCSARAFKLLKAFPSAEVILADYGEVPQSGGVNSIKSLGKYNPDTIAHNLLNFCLDLGAGMLVPLNKPEIISLVKASVLFEEFAVKLLLPERNIIDQFLYAEVNQFSDFIVVSDGIQVFPPLLLPVQENLNGVFWTDDQGKPVKMFTID